MALLGLDQPDHCGEGGEGEGGEWTAWSVCDGKCLLVYQSKFQSFHLIGQK